MYMSHGTLAVKAENHGISVNDPWDISHESQPDAWLMSNGTVSQSLR